MKPCNLDSKDYSMHCCMLAMLMWDTPNPHKPSKYGRQP